jgi:hypothetical protein
MSSSPAPKASWRPKYKEREAQCASCPFLDGNDEEFAKVVNALRRSRDPDARPATKARVRNARISVRLDVLMGHGDLVCHGTAYGPGMIPAPQKDWRQCPGATRAKREIDS